MTARSCRYWGSAAVMIRELVEGSAWICPPVEGLGRGLGRGRGRAGGACQRRAGGRGGRTGGSPPRGASRVRGQCRAQGDCEPGGFGILEVDDVDVAGGALRSRLVQLFHQRAHQVQPCRIGGAYQQCVATAFGNHGGPKGGVHLPLARRRRATPPGAAGVDQALDHRCDVRGQGVAQGNDLHVRGVGHVQRADDAREPLQVVGVVGDYQRVVAGVDVDGVVGADQRPQDRHQVGGGFVVQPEDLRHDLAAALGRADRHRAALQLGIRLGDHLEQAADIDNRETGQPQSCQELVVGHPGRDRAVGAEVDRAFDAGIHDDVAPGDRRHRARHGLDVGVDEVQGDRLVGSLGIGDAQRTRCEQASDTEDSQSMFHVSLW